MAASAQTNGKRLQSQLQIANTRVQPAPDQEQAGRNMNRRAEGFEQVGIPDDGGVDQVVSPQRTRIQAPRPHPGRPDHHCRHGEQEPQARISPPGLPGSEVLPVSHHCPTIAVAVPRPLRFRVNTGPAKAEPPFSAGPGPSPPDCAPVITPRFRDPANTVTSYRATRNAREHPPRSIVGPSSVGCTPSDPMHGIGCGPLHGPVSRI